MKTAAAPQGFTLIEMLVVLLIIGMAMTVVPALLNSLPGARLRAAADDMAGTLRSLRAQAIALGQGTTLSLDPRSRTYETVPATGRHTLPASVNAVDVTTTFAPQAAASQAAASPAAAPPAAASLGDAPQAAAFHFFADGTATGGTITLHAGARVSAIAVDWLTGRVRRLD